MKSRQLWLVLIIILSFSLPDVQAAEEDGEVVNPLLHLLLGKSGSTKEKPIVLFSDLVSGPGSGNGDNAGGLQKSEHGAIVTLWGYRLGSAQGRSRILVGGKNAAHIYYWKDADGQTPGGPSDLASYHHLQEIAFSIPASLLPMGTTSIVVEVDGKASAPVPFTVIAGNIYFVSSSGNDSTGDGSWEKPWQTIDHVGRNQNGSIGPGDIVYIVGSVTETDGTTLRFSGSSGAPVALVGYPGAEVWFTGLYNSTTLLNWYQQQGYWTFSKFSINTEGTGMSGFTDMRVVGVEVTGPQAEGYGGSIGCGEANAEALDGTCGGGKYFGMYVHDFGNDTTSQFHHTTYISNRDGAPNKAFEFGWNYFRDNKAVHGFHIYDQSPGGDWIGTIKIHDNVVVNQKGPAVNLMSGGAVITVPVDIYNNIFINCGLGPDIPRPGQEPFSVPKYAISLTEGIISSNVKIYNNVIYGYGDQGTGYAVNKTFGGTVDLKNNILVDTKDLPYVNGIPEVQGNNIFYNGGNDFPSAPPGWALDSLDGDPFFVNPAAGDFRLKKISPAIDNGSSAVSGSVKTDFVGVERPQGEEYDMGVFEQEERYNY